MAELMYKVTFVGERNRRATREVSIVGSVFERGQEVVATENVVEQLKAHPQVKSGQFIFRIEATAPKRDQKTDRRPHRRGNEIEVVEV
jgi:hypothetical protein